MAVRIKLHSYCYVYRDDLPLAVERDLIDQSTHKDPQFQRLRRMGYGTANLSPYIVTCADQGNRLRFWRGSLGRIIRTLKRHKIEYLIQDRRLWLPRLDMNCTIRLRDYQKPAFRAMVRRQQTLFRGAAGSGFRNSN